MAELRCTEVTKSYGDRVVLSHVDLVVPEGTLTAILGASGSGKTTLLRLVIGFLRLDGGSIEVGGDLVAHGPEIHLAPEKRLVGYVAQEGALYPHLNVAQNVGFGLPRSERKSSGRIDEVLELVGLGAGYAKRHTHELSGGEQRRVALARALAPQPRLVLLDEPFAGLDASLRVETREAVLRALKEAKTTALLVTHDQAEALSMGREVAVLRDGRLVQTDPPSVVYGTPSDVEVARFVGDAVVLPGRAAAGMVTCALGQLAVIGDCDQPCVDVVLRPEQIQVRTRSEAENGTEQRDMTGTVIETAYYGSETMVRVSVAGTNGLVVDARVFSHLAPEVGAAVSLEVTGPAVVYPRGTTTEHTDS